MDKEKISVIIPAYNAEKTIEKCLLSITMGGYKNIEVIVINDGSIDNTASVVQNLSKDDKRILLISQENKGVAAARNTGLNNATGEYIAWCDADDFVEPTWLANMYNHLVKYSADIAICRCVVDNNYEEIKEPVVWSKSDAVHLFLEHSRLNGSMVNKLFTKKLFNGVFFDEHLSYFEDDLVFWNILKKTDCIVRFFNQEYHIVVHTDSLTNKPCNSKRVEAISVWKNIWDEAKELYPANAGEAERQYAYQAYNTLLAMFRGNYYDSRSEIALQAIIKEHIIGIQLCKQIKHKAMYLLIGVSVKMARRLY